MVSAQTLENVSVCAAVSAMVLTTADSETAGFIAGELERAAVRRIQREGELSLAALAHGGDPEEERLILQTWTQWYLDSVDTIRDLEVGEASESTELVLAAVREAVDEAGRKALGNLGG